MVYTSLTPVGPHSGRRTGRATPGERVVELEGVLRVRPCPDTSGRGSPGGPPPPWCHARGEGRQGLGADGVETGLPRAAPSEPPRESEGGERERATV